MSCMMDTVSSIGAPTIHVMWWSRMSGVSTELPAGWM